MKKTLLAPVVLSLVGLPGLVAANEFSGAVTLSYGDTHSDGPTAETLGLDGRVELVTETGLSFRGRFDSVKGSMAAVDGDLTGTLAGASVGYRLGETFGTGLYIERADLDSDDADLDGALTSFGATLGLVNSGFNLDGFYGRSTVSPEVDGLTIEDFGLFASIEQGPALTLAGNFVNTRLSADGGSVDLNVIGAAAAYAVNDQITVFGGANRSNLDDVGLSLTTLGLGVSYDTTAMSQFGSVLSVEYARNSLSVDGESGDAGTLRLGVTLPFGAKAAKVPDSSVAGAVLRPTHNALSSAVLSAF